MKCETCGRELRNVEIGLSRKLINRGTEIFFCLDCLAEKYTTTEQKLIELAEYYSKHGCTLFR